MTTLEEVKKLLSKKSEEKWILTEKSAIGEYKLICAGFKSFDEAIDILIKCYWHTQKSYLTHAKEIEFIENLWNPKKEE